MLKIETRRTKAIKSVAMVAILATFGAGAAYAQSPTPAKAPPATASMNSSSPSQGANASTLIGRDVQNLQGETVGEINSIYLDKDGKVDSVIVGVGGFLGMGEREAKFAWKDLKIMNGGEKVTVNMTKDQIKDHPEYRYPNATYRGQVFNDTGVWNDRNTRASTNMSANTRTVSTGDFNASGQMSTNAVVGASIRNTAKEAIGTIEDAYVDKDGAIQVVIVSVGGFLGMGTKHVAVEWSDITFGRDGNELLLTTDWTKDALKEMPDYKYERRVSANRAG